MSDRPVRERPVRERKEPTDDTPAESASGRIGIHEQASSADRRRSDTSTGQAPEPIGEGERATRERGYTDREELFRRHYDAHFANRGRGYDYYRPVYQYGWDLAHSRTYRDADWGRVESEARRQWEMRNPNTWDEVRDAIHEGFNAARERTIERR